MPEGKDPENGQFIEGNDFWRVAFENHTIGKPRKFKTPEQLKEACAGYFDWVWNNPLSEEKVFNGPDGIVRATVDKMRAMTIIGLCNHLGIGERTWRDMRDTREDLQGVIEFVEQLIKQQKVEGAMAGLLKETIVMRELGMHETTRLAGHDGQELNIIDDWSQMEIARRFAFVLAQTFDQKQKQLEHTNGNSETKQPAE